MTQIRGAITNCSSNRPALRLTAWGQTTCKVYARFFLISIAMMDDERAVPRFTAFPCQRRTCSGDLTRPGREPAPTRPDHKRDYYNPPAQTGGRTGARLQRAGLEQTQRGSGWPPTSGIAWIRSRERRAFPCLSGGRSGWRSCV